MTNIQDMFIGESPIAIIVTDAPGKEKGASSRTVLFLLGVTVIVKLGDIEVLFVLVTFTGHRPANVDRPAPFGYGNIRIPNVL